jgi:vitamin B12 transporter
VGRGTFRATNIDRALLGGAEVTASLAAHGLRTQASYTLLLTEDRATGLPLPGRPQHDLVYDAAYRVGPVRERYGLDLLAGVTYGSDGPIGLPAHALHGVGASLDVPGVKGLRLALDVENLFDLRTLYLDSPLLGKPIVVPLSDFLGFPLPGRTLWATVQFTRPAP